MPLILDATPGGAAANSYVSVADAQAYFDARMHVSAWTNATTPNKELALCAATARLEQEGYTGWRYSDAQRLKWPRDGAKDEDGVVFGPADVPDRVKFATCELALHMLAAGTTDTQAASGLEPFAALSVAGSVDLTLRDIAPAPGALPTPVVRWLRPVLATRASVKLVRG